MDDDEAAPPAPESAPERVPAPAPLNPRQVRARRRRRRRQLGTLVFVVVAAAVLGAAYLAVAGGEGGSSGRQAASSSTSIATTTTAAFTAAYKVTTGVNVRQGPGTNTPTVATIEQGHDVTVACVVQGEVVNAPSGPNPQWLKVTDPGAAGYVSAAFVSTGDDLRANKIPACPAA